MGTGAGYDYPTMVTVLMDTMPTPEAAAAKTVAQATATKADLASAQPAAASNAAETK